MRLISALLLVVLSGCDCTSPPPSSSPPPPPNDAGGASDAGHGCAVAGCAPGEYCEPTLGECVSGCLTDAHCAQPGTCDTAQQTCTCREGTRLCGTACLAESATSCGPNCEVCTASGPTTAPACIASRCEERCAPGYVRCNGACQSGATAPVHWGPYTSIYVPRTHPATLAVLDVDGDGREDFVVDHVFDYTNAWLNLDDGGFAPAGLLDDAGTSTVALVTADIDQDGVQDLVRSTWDSTVVLHRRGPGQLVPGAPLEGGITARRSVADVDQNGYPDLLVAEDGQFAVYLGSDAGFVRVEGHRVPLTRGRSALAFGDADGDGRLDVLAAHDAVPDSGYPDSTAFFTVFPGFGDGRFDAGTTPVHVGGGPPRDVALEDVTGDGKADVVVLNNSSSNSVLALPGGGDFTFGSTWQPLSDLYRPGRFDLVDLNHDRALDLLVASAGGFALHVALNDGGTFPVFNDLTVQNEDMATGDFNRDGITDILAVGGASSLRVYWGTCGP